MIVQKKILLFSVFLISAFGTAFAKSKKAPEWLNSSYAGLSEDQFIASVSSGSSADNADNKAISSVASIIRQDISAEENVTQSADSTGNDLQTYLTNITTNSQIKNISGLYVKDRYKDKKGIYYSRAVLDKSAAGKYYSLELNKNVLEADSLVELAESSEDAFYACKQLFKAYKIAVDNDEIASILSVIKPQAHHVFSYGSSAEIAKKIQTRLSKVTVYINCQNDTEGRLFSAASQAVNDFGIETSGSKENAMYVFDVNVSYEDVEKPSDSDIYYTRYNVSCSLKSSRENNTVITYTKNGRQGKLSRQEAQQSAVRAAEKAIIEEFSVKFGALFSE